MCFALVVPRNNMKPCATTDRYTRAASSYSLRSTNAKKEGTLGDPNICYISDTPLVFILG